jgi:hypothetical protein
MVSARHLILKLGFQGVAVIRYRPDVLRPPAEGTLTYQAYAQARL